MTTSLTATLHVTVSVLQTKADAQCDELETVELINSTNDGRRDVVKMQKNQSAELRVSDDVPEGSNLISGDTTVPL